MLPSAVPAKANSEALTHATCHIFAILHYNLHAKVDFDSTLPWEERNLDIFLTMSPIKGSTVAALYLEMQ